MHDVFKKYVQGSELTVQCQLYSYIHECNPSINDNYPTLLVILSSSFLLFALITRSKSSGCGRLLTSSKYLLWYFINNT